MHIFHSDLDNTIIYSYKHDIGSDKKNVEVYQGREISFITSRTYELLQKVVDRVLFVPTTTRTIEQYERINLGIGMPKYALVCNGGVLLENGKENQEWYEESRAIILDSSGEMRNALDFLENDARRKFELRYIRELFVFTKCCNPEEVVCDLKNHLDTSLADVFNNGEKVYVLPKNLDKGTAVKRFRKKVGGDYVFAAGDSEFDVSMLEAADLGIAPESLKEKCSDTADITWINSDELLAERALQMITQ